MSESLNKESLYQALIKINRLLTKSQSLMSIKPTKLIIHPIEKDANMKKFRPLKFEVRRQKNLQWYAVILASNGRMLWRTSESYLRKRSAQKAIALVIRHAVVEG